jgi:hypothetical protein
MSEHQMDGCPALIFHDQKSEPMYCQIRDGQIKNFAPTDLVAMKASFVKPN